MNARGARARGARADNHCETQGIHRFTENMLFKHLDNKCVNARGTRGENRCQTQGIHRFTVNMLLKHYEKQ